MGLIPGARARLDCWGWRARYWWHDTQDGARARLALFYLLAFVAVVQAARVGVATVELPGLVFAAEPPPGAMYAIYNWVVQLIIALILLAVSAAMRPRPPEPEAQEFNAPVIEDGTKVKDYFGTVWIGDEFWLAHRMVGRDKIKTKGSKK